MSVASAIARVAEIRTQMTALVPAQSPARATGGASFAATLDQELGAGIGTTGGRRSAEAGSGATATSPAALSLVAALNPGGATTVPASGLASRRVAAALRWLGTPYSWGGGGPQGPTRGVAQGASTVGFDCSSLTQYAYAQTGVSIPRTSQEQFRAGATVAPEALLPGDLVFFDGVPPGHVGMYIGHGEFIHAPHTGDVVKISSMTSGHYRDVFSRQKCVLSPSKPRKQYHLMSRSTGVTS